MAMVKKHGQMELFTEEIMSWERRKGMENSFGVNQVNIIKDK